MFRLTFTLRNLKPGTDVSLEIHDKNGLLPMTMTHRENIVTVEVSVNMPIHLTIWINSELEVLGANLSHINFNLEKLNQHLVYHPGSQDPTQSLVWDRFGHAVLDLFDTDPFTYHLHIGTTVRL
jgi:hypothetical protein